MAYRIISVSYGHGTSNGKGGYTASGKLYDYATEKEYRAGDVVVVPVQHPKSGKLYNTLAVVQTTSDMETGAGMAKAEFLTDPQKGIKPKDVGLRLEVAKMQGLDVENQRDVTVRTLPGYSTRKSKEKWSESAPKSSSRLITRGD